MTKKTIFICVLLIVFGFTGVASATRMNYSSKGSRDSGLKLRYSSHEIENILKIVRSLKPSRRGHVNRNVQRDWPINNKMIILKKLFKGKLNRWQHLEKIRNGRWLVRYKRCDLKKSVPEPATMLLLGSCLIVIAGFGRKKFRNKDNK